MYFGIEGLEEATLSIWLSSAEFQYHNLYTSFSLRILSPHFRGVLRFKYFFGMLKYRFWKICIETYWILFPTLKRWIFIRLSWCVVIFTIPTNYKLGISAPYCTAILSSGTNSDVYSNFVSNYMELHRTLRIKLSKKITLFQRCLADYLHV